MDDNPPYDPRILANLILSIRDGIGILTTQLEIQKLSFFCHADWLRKTKEPLVGGYFEAWKHGPVHPTLYREFKCYGDRPIDKLASSTDLLTGKRTSLPQMRNTHARQAVYATVSALSAYDGPQLVGLSHKRGGAWDRTVNKGRTDIVLGMRIEDRVILESDRIRPVSTEPERFSEDEISPFASD
ncbi:Panacea domain-containing protein [Thalassococcus sp. S3]|uniref:Panacea domain-containing protein n=1 Tax=Thalassococcus sp. S3 TaxID=2017482 RepID=UPI00102484F1|nr:hypothetical protein CFI11_07310 [Thalassococcus sp. S3]